MSTRKVGGPRNIQSQGASKQDQAKWLDSVTNLLVKSSLGRGTNKREAFADQLDPFRKTPAEAVREATERLPEQGFTYDREPFAPGTEEYRRYWAEHDRLSAFPVVGTTTLSKKASPSENPSREKRTLPAFCSSPKRVVYRNKTTGRDDFLATRCMKPTCPECRAWRCAIDATRLTEGLDGRTLWRQEVEDERWEAVQKRSQRRGTTYAAVPQPGGARVVFSSSPLDSEIEADPVQDVTAEVTEAVEARPLDWRSNRISHSRSRRFRSFDEVADEWLGKQPKREDRVLIGWTSRRVDPAQLHRVAVEHGLDARQITAHGEPIGTAVRSAWEAPRYRTFRRALGFVDNPDALPWYKDGPPPNPGDKGYEKYMAAKFPRPVHPYADDVPWDVLVDDLSTYEQKWAEAV